MAEPVLLLCELDGSKISLFGQMMQCLARTGEHVYIEAAPAGMVMRTLNSSCSAFAKFELVASFFSRFVVDVAQVQRHEQANAAEAPSSGLAGELGSSVSAATGIKCKMLLKAALTAFRSKGLARHATMALTSQAMVFRQSFDHEVIRTYRIPFDECDIVQAVYSKESIPHHIRVLSAETLLHCLDSFATRTAEVCLAAGPEGLAIKSHRDSRLAGGEYDGGQMHTSIMLNAADFHLYQVNAQALASNGPAEVMLCLKELKQMLNFCKTLVTNHAQSVTPVSLHIDRAGAPVVLSVGVLNQLSVDFVLASVADDADRGAAASSQAASAGGGGGGGAGASSQQQQPPPPPQHHQQQSQQHMHRHAAPATSQASVSSVVDAPRVGALTLSDQARELLASSPVSTSVPKLASTMLGQAAQAIRLALGASPAAADAATPAIGQPDAGTRKRTRGMFGLSDGAEPDSAAQLEPDADDSGSCVEDTPPPPSPKRRRLD